MEKEHVEDQSNFNFSAEQHKSLRKILGDFPKALEYIEKAEVLVSVELYCKKYERASKKTKRERIEEIKKIRDCASALSSAISCLQIEYGVPLSPQKIKEQDIGIFNALMQSQYKPENLSKGLRNMDPPYFIELDSCLQELVFRCNEGLEYIGPTKRGDKSWAQEKLDRFDLELVFWYRAIFGCFPATTRGGAFERAVKIFYSAAKYSNSNIQKRIRDEVKSQKKLFEREPDVLRKLAAIRNLHPNG